MSKDLHPSILTFFHQRMDEHSNVRTIEDVSTDEFYLFRIERDRPRDSILVWLSDAYLFTESDFFNRPPELEAGHFILVAKPEGGFIIDDEVIDNYRIGVGQIGKFMGALRSSRMWTYLTAEEKEGRARASRR